MVINKHKAAFDLVEEQSLVTPKSYMMQLMLQRHSTVSMKTRASSELSVREMGFSIITPHNVPRKSKFIH